MSNAFVSKSRRVRFELSLRIIDLNNVPLVSGTSFVKWHLPSSTAAEHRGRTQKCAIKDHRVQYEYEKQTSLRLIVGKDGVLQECSIHFEVIQEYSAGGRAERIVLGHIKLNLAEYVDAAETMSANGGGGGGGAGDTDGDDRITRRYLMQESKINSTLKIGVQMRQMEGTRDYRAPALRTAPVFGGIAGVISSSEPASSSHAGLPAHLNGEAAEGAESAIGNGSSLPNLISSNRELGEMQDMYRRTLAAYWASQPGELKADECIEDIFAGGDGWGKNGRPPPVDQSNPLSDSAQDAEGTGARNTSSPSKMNPSGRAAQRLHKQGLGRFGEKYKPPQKGRGELEEVEVREDLVGWHISDRAYT